jgi:AraC family transcriptional regulator of adaptative response / DNA-3-methyladenine glycosylase II
MDRGTGFERAALDRARRSRDPRFDGRFFIAVLSTRIYCRPICPVPSPKPANIRYYRSAAAAAEAGFRPCLRCRPEAAPGTPAWLGTSAVVRRALRLIEAGALDAGSVTRLAAQVGIGARHLHRLFVEHVGASPITVAQTRRLLFAKQLLDETDLPITEIALASGFGSVRRFNASFLETYGRSPRELRRTRRRGAVTAGVDEVVVRLAFRPPYDWAHMHTFLAARALPGVERVDVRGYARTLRAPQGVAVVSVRPLAGVHALELRLRGVAPSLLFVLCAAARRMFDLAADPAHIQAALEGDVLLGPLVRQRPGLRMPGSWSAFECAVRVLLGERATCELAQRRAGQLVARWGARVVSGEAGLTHVFPDPKILARADLESAGCSSARAAAVRALARATVEGLLDWSGSVEELHAALVALPGWSANAARYVALSGLGDPDAFPCGEALAHRLLLDPSGHPSPSGAAAGRAPLSGRGRRRALLEARAETWRPWRAYALLHLWQAQADQEPAGRRAP